MAVSASAGASPLYQRADFLNGTTKNRFDGDVEVTAETRYSNFNWPNWGCANFSVPSDPECAQQLNVAMNQPYEVFATAFYYLPAPEG